MEQDILKFPRDPGQTQFEFQDLPTSYLHLTAHRLAGTRRLGAPRRTSRMGLSARRMWARPSCLHVRPVLPLPLLPSSDSIFPLMFPRGSSAALVLNLLLLIGCHQGRVPQGVQAEEPQEQVYRCCNFLTKTNSHSRFAFYTSMYIVEINLPGVVYWGMMVELISCFRCKFFIQVGKAAGGRWKSLSESVSYCAFVCPSFSRSCTRGVCLNVPTVFD